MKPIFILAMVAIGATAIGVGSLNNEIDLTLQDFGVGSEDIMSPIGNATINYIIEPIKVDTDQGSVLKNLITNCLFSSAESIDGDYTIICKLTDENSNVVAEGRVIDTDYIADSEIKVPITLLAYDEANAVTNIHDTTLIVMDTAVPVPLPEVPEVPPGTE